LGTRQFYDLPFQNPALIFRRKKMLLCIQRPFSTPRLVAHDKLVNPILFENHEILAIGQRWLRFAINQVFDQFPFLLQRIY